jgi:short-subunit dehydrogenase
MAETALVTGASGGIGEEVARLLAAKGIDLILVARSGEKLSRLRGELKVRVETLPLDLAAPDAAAKVLAFADSASMDIDLLVNNAGVGTFGPFAESDPDAELAQIRLNVSTLTHLTRLVLPGMLRRGRGRILNVASTAAFQPGPKMAVYFATKAFVLSLSEALHEELRPHGIRVTCLCPGPTRTEFGDVAGFGGNGLFDRVAMESPQVVKAGLDGLDKNKAVVVPGWVNKLTANSGRFAPRAVVRKIAGAIKY